MTKQLVIGSVVLCFTVLIHTGFFFAALSAAFFIEIYRSLGSRRR